MHERDARVDGPDAEGFRLWTPGPDGFNATFGPIRVRVEGDVARCRVGTGASRANLHGALHGGFLMACLDQTMFMGAIALGRLATGSAVTLNASFSFIGPGRVDEDLDVLVEVVGETGRMLFVRGSMVQDDHLVMSFQGTLRKVGGSKA